MKPEHVIGGAILRARTRAALLTLFVALSSAVRVLAQETPATRWPDFPVLVWRLDKPNEPLPAQLTQAFGGVNVEGASEDTWAIEQGLDFYIGHGPGRNDLHIDSDRPSYRALWQRYWDEREATILVREPCLNEERTRERLLQTLTRSLAARAGNAGLGVSLGDEVGLTPFGAPLDLCASEACRAHFASFVKTTETWRALVQEDAVAPPFPDTDTTRLAWVAGNHEPVFAWLARRAFHARTVTDTLHSLVQSSRALSPGTPVGLFGQSGRTAFGDVDLPEVLPFLDFIEVYRLLDSRELVYTLRGPTQRSLLTLFRDPEAPDGPAWIAWEHWLRGGEGLVVWSDRELLADPSYFERLRDTTADLRRLKRELPEWRPAPSGVALIHSADSLSLSWLRDALIDGPTWMRRFPSYHNEHGTREVSLRALLRLLEDQGFLPGAIPIANVAPQLCSRFPVLIASELILLDEGEIEALAAFLRAGGELVVVGDFGTYDRHGTTREPDEVFQRLAVDDAKVQRMPLDAQRYLRERWRTQPSFTYPRSLDATSSTLCQSARTRAPQWTIDSRVSGKESSWPWLRATQPAIEANCWIAAALPNATSAIQRATLTDLEIHLRVAEGYAIERLHPIPKEDEPEESFTLRAGDALVIRIQKL